jgi:predicted transcriptional regulator
MRRRSKYRVIRDILAVRRGNKTEFLYEARLNSRQLNKYLGLLVKSALIEKAEEAPVANTYEITPKGEKVLAKLEELIRALDVNSDSTDMDEIPALVGDSVSGSPDRDY